VVNGVLAPCRTIIDKAERTVFLERDTAMLNGYYEQLLIEILRTRVAALP
jgi:hypothetical protein